MVFLTNLKKINNLKIFLLKMALKKNLKNIMKKILKILIPKVIDYSK